MENSSVLSSFHMNCFDIIFQRSHVLVGRVKNTNVYFCISDVGCIKLIWYHNNMSEPSASDEVSFEEVLDILGENISDEFIFNLNLFKNNRYEYKVKKE